MSPTIRAPMVSLTEARLEVLLRSSAGSDTITYTETTRRAVGRRERPQHGSLLYNLTGFTGWFRFSSLSEWFFTVRRRPSHDTLK